VVHGGQSQGFIVNPWYGGSGEVESMNPRLSVVVPTYNRTEELQGTLASLAAQRFPVDEFEVIVADDGSSDLTAEVVRSFESRLALRYYFQEDRGMRLAAVRNAGARMATAPVLVFLDTGAIAGPEFLGGHLGLHAGNGGGPRAVAGYTYGYRPFDPTPGLGDAVATLTPERVRAYYGDDPSFQDCRHEEFASVDFDVNALPLPWIMFWGVNLSVGAEEFWRVGGFDESFQGWGLEDLDLGLRLYKRGVRFMVGREAWAVESPHERDPAGNSDSVTRNALQLLRKFPEPALELNWAWFDTREWLVQDNSAALHAQYQSLRDWTARVRGLRVDDEIDAAVLDLPAGSSVAVFGCGASVPRSLPTSILIDFDAEALAEAGGDLPHQTHHALGLRTVLPDQSVDLVVITSRLQGVWQRYGVQILAEAHRVGRAVHNWCQDASVSAS
jgi:GT2 family glycosyltransferase